MQILTIRTKFEAFECKFELFERDWKHSNAYSSHWEGIVNNRMEIGTIRSGGFRGGKGGANAPPFGGE